MSHDIIDNRTHKLVDHIRKILPGSRAAKFAVGYFFLSGLETVADKLDSIQDFRLLIGNTTNKETLEQIAEGYRRLEQVEEKIEEQQYPKRREMEIAAEKTAEHIGETASLMDQTDQSEELVSVLVRLIQEERLSVKVYTRGRLHAKAYIFDYGKIYDQAGKEITREEKGISITGSSNFTLSGVTSNTELNVLVHGNTNHQVLTEWFEDLWEEAEDFEEHLLTELKQSWPLAQVTPYDIYLKTLYELVCDRLEGEAAEELLWRDDIQTVLTEFQERAVREAIQMIRRYRGCFVSDVVGLGKSYIGAAILKHFERHDRARALIICPASLVEMWEHYNEAYQLNARVLSMGMLREDERYGAAWMLYDEKYKNRDIVLVDESHNFQRTRSQRYKVLQNYLSTGNRKAVFLTATPYSKSIWDIYNQLKLFHQVEITSLPIDPPKLKDYFKLVEKNKKRLPELLSHILIRRPRVHILRWYGYDAETDRRVDPHNFEPYKTGQKKAYVKVGNTKQFFPERTLRTIDYSIEETYSGLYQQLRRHIGRTKIDMDRDPEALTYARYGLWNYVVPEKKEQAPYTDLKRAGINLRGLMRIMLFKRFESSVHAFRETVKRLLRIHQDFLTALENGIIAAGEEAQQLLYESDQLEEQALLDALEEMTGRYDPRDFEAEKLHQDIIQDILILEKMLKLVAPITPEEDDKLITLKRFLRKPNFAGRKVLIFTQYADTAQYVYDNLTTIYGDDLEVIYSTGKNKARVVGRFAPKANPQQVPEMGFQEINTLVATDVLSEGLNLQDCDNVINYDLHWNPVRLIQRFGRIDRIGSEHEEIFAYNFLPETKLEAQLGLKEKLERRIHEIHQMIGEDAAILEPDERLNEEAMYTIYSEGDINRYEDDEIDEYVDLNEALEIIRQIREDEPGLYRRISELRDGIRCGYQAEQEGTMVYCKSGEYQQLYLVDGQGEIITREIPYILNLLKCDPGTPAQPLPEGYNQIVMNIKEQFEAEVKARNAEQEHTRNLTRAQRYILKQIQILYRETDNQEIKKQLHTLSEAFNQYIPIPALRAAINRIRRDGLTGEAFLDELTQIYHLHRMDEYAWDDRRLGSSKGNDTLPRIVCSEGLTDLF
jgi:superfamily II DNA or RNA helicase